ncbi:Metallo-beta-lactamase fold-containing protein [uncultured archaeon]|nr:Metallo-beta-lactamase fold-containing protein [uncultured archaeon]
MQISDKIHALKVPFQITDKSGLKVPRFVYVYLIYGEKICLIDSGVASSEQFVFDYLRITGRRPEDISLLVLTHSHPDHIGSALAIKEASGCTIAAHVAEKAWIEDVDLQSRERPVPGFHSLVGGSVKVDRALKEGDLLDLGGSLNLKVIHTPGHSEGSISLWLEEGGVLFTGDAIPLPGEMPVYDDPQASVKSIKRLKAIVGIEFLLAAWDQPRDGEQAYRIMDESLRYIQRIHEAVIRISREHPTLDSMELTKGVLKELGMPETMANPMIARSFQANLKVRNHSDLLQD